MTQPTTCRTCKAEIQWAVVAKSGKGVPLDVEPSADGKCYVVDTAADGRPLVEYVSNDKPAPAGVELRTSHFQTCPDAQSWSRSKGVKK